MLDNRSGPFTNLGIPLPAIRRKIHPRNRGELEGLEVQFEHLFLPPRSSRRHMRMLRPPTSLNFPPRAHEAFMQNCDHCDSPGPCWPVLPLTMLALASPANAWQQSLYEDLGSILTPVDGSGPGLEVADLNGDGVVDILKGGGGAFTDMNDTLVVLFGRGDGRFEQSPHPMPAQQEMVMDFALGDVDGDGDLDVFIGLGKFGHPTQDRLWLNDGNGQFSDASVLLPPALNYTASVLLEDLDGDGDLDAVGGNSWDMGPSTYLLLNDGFGSFSDASDQLPSSLGAGVYSLAAVDLDGDGDEDLVLGSGNSNPPCGTGCCDFVPALSRIWINDGQANFAESVGRLPHAGHVTQDIAVGDVDGDGDPDLILGNRGYGDFGHHGEDQLLICLLYTSPSPRD